ncbi:MAG: adenylate/guanylate cyclase domain-containing protein [Spirochaetota bacterium]
MLKLKYASKRNWRYVATITICGMVFGMILAMIQSNQISLRKAANGALDAFFMAGSTSFYHMFIFNGYLHERARKLTFLGVLLLNSSIYVILLILGRTIGGLLSGYLSSWQSIKDDPFWLQTIVIAAILALVINFILQLEMLIGRGELYRFISGRYHRPLQEERVFLFLDLVSSTSIAEEIGDKKFLDLLDTFYSHMTESILQTQACIYKYVGDEIILSWLPKKAARHANCLRFPILFQQELESRKEFYQEHFGLFPRFRAAVHAGSVITGEMGELKKEIVYLGDVLNTTARVTELCRTLKQTVLVTQEVLDMTQYKDLSSSTGLYLEDMGEHELRGKEGQVRVYAVDPAPNE